jgi:ABC-type sugar transport system permease subunit
MSVQSRLKRGFELFRNDEQMESSRFETLASLPSVVFIVGLFGFPIAFLLYVSVTQNVLSIVRPVEFVGLDNYAQVLTSAEFWEYFGNTVFFSAATIAIGFPIQLGIALMLNTDLPYQRAWQTLIILPWAMPQVITTTLWRLLFNPTFGAINWILNSIGLISGPINWFGGKWVAFSTIIATDIWIRTPLVVLILLAGLQTIPKEQYEAARMDGAGTWDRFVHVTLPKLRPAIITVLVLRVILALRVFDIVYAMTLGGPGDATTVIGIDIFEKLINFGQVSLAAAEAAVLVLLIYVMIGVAVYLFPSYQSEAREEAT